MQQGEGDLRNQYYHNYPQPQYQNPTSNDLTPNNPFQPTFASAPPFSAYPPPPSDFSTFSSSTYPPFPQNPDPIPNLPPSAPSYTQPPLLPSLFSSSPTPDHYYPYDHNQSPLPNYASNPNPNPIPNSAPYASSYSHLGSSVTPVYETSYGTGAKFNRSAYFDDNANNYSQFSYNTNTATNLEQHDIYENIPGSIRHYADGTYAYDGGRVEPYGAQGTGKSSSSSWSGFDDYGRSTRLLLRKDQTVGLGKIVRAVPKVETLQDANNGVQKFRVKILPEGAGQSTMDVLCQIGLDGIHMLDPSTNRTLRIYPLGTVTRWEVMESTIYTFWAKSSVDIEPRRIRLKSNSYTTNSILDTMTAAAVQLKEMGGKDSFSGRSRGNLDAGNQSEQATEKKKGFVDWMNLIKPGNEEKDHWVPDEVVTKCTACATDFGAFVRKHHCRNCGDIFCDKCTQGRIALTADEQAQPVRVCDRCMAEVSQRLSNAKEATSKSAVQKTHEDLARKLQEEMDKNRKPSSGSRSSDGSGKRMREVACPTCTVHLQVQVPSSGSETIECGVCQHPFLVSAH
eukprot:TRINITY_DN397_c0_g1_i2.p1 TRINITY_DN397_c0_g1~~TRINITY_DN397_c0_g1_i2.p1  ORF type:complete len:565 (-),score=79.84 TRINITY_DN397_c0_g1_i2:296-1990(-)